jgi:hypothetical protein
MTDLARWAHEVTAQAQRIMAGERFATVSEEEMRRHLLRRLATSHPDLVRLQRARWAVLDAWQSGSYGKVLSDALRGREINVMDMLDDAIRAVWDADAADQDPQVAGSPPPTDRPAV